MTAATLEQANAKLKAAVKERLDNTPSDDPKLATVSCCEGQRTVVSASWDNAEAARADCERQLRGDSLLRERRAAGSPEWLDALDRLRALHHEKTAQYGGADDAFENVTASAKCGVEPWRRALCDLSDCVVRMQKYAQGQPVDPTNALLDAANWALICLIKMEETGRGS
jgi:hypothetical protein